MFSFQSGELLPNENFVANFFYTPARDWVERRRAQGFSSPQAETGMMQRTSQGIPNDEALR